MDLQNIWHMKPRLVLDNDNELYIFERIYVLWRIFIPVRERQVWKFHINKELYVLYRDMNVSKFIKLDRHCWAAHVTRIDDSEIPKKLMTEVFCEKRRVSRLKRKSLNRMKLDTRNILGISSWIFAVQDRVNWRRLLGETQMQ